MQVQVQFTPGPSGASYHFFHYHFDARESKAGRVFVKNCQRSSPWVGSRAVIIQAVTAVQANKTGPRLRRRAVRLLVAGVGLLGIAYGADYCVFRYRLATKRQPFGSVTVEHYYEVAHKDGKAEIIFDPPVQKTCVHSLFPHSGDPPCWFLIRHAERRTDRGPISDYAQAESRALGSAHRGEPLQCS